MEIHFLTWIWEAFVFLLKRSYIKRIIRGKIIQIANDFYQYAFFLSVCNFFLSIRFSKYTLMVWPNSRMLLNWTDFNVMIMDDDPIKTTICNNENCFFFNEKTSISISALLIYIFAPLIASNCLYFFPQTPMWRWIQKGALGFYL